jgi:hypothetical protein
MNAIELLRTARAVAHAVELRVDAGSDLAGLLPALAARLPAPARSVLIGGRSLRLEEGAVVHGALMGGETVVVALQEDHRFGHDLLRAWDRYLESPRHTSASVGRAIRFEPVRQDFRPGLLVLVTTDPSHVDGVLRLSLDENEVRDLMASSQAGEPDHRLGTPAGALTMRDLCRLHLRDPRGTRRRPLGEALNADDPFTWTDLQVLLRQQPSTGIALLEQLHDRGRVTTEERDIAHLARDFLVGRRTDGPRGATPVWPSVFDAVWHLWFLEPGGHVFRGQADARWSLDPTLFRPPPGGSGPDVKTLLDRVEATRRFVDLLRQRQDEFFARCPVDDELLAVAQHYGFPTPLLDYTRSMAVAALFATMGAGGAGPIPEVGVIYFMDARRGELGLPPEEEEHPAFSLRTKAQVRIGDVQLIEPALDDADDRIARQAGLFLSGFETSHLKTIAIDRIFFRQIAGEVYEDEAVGATRAQILPDHSRLAELADQVRADHRRQADSAPSLPPLLANALLPERGLIGSEGAHLFRQLREGHEFLDELHRHTEDRSAAVADVLNRYFDLSAARARVGDVPDGAAGTAAIDPLGTALQELAGMYGLDGASLERRVRDELGPLDNRFFEDKSIEASSGDEALALSVGLFLASWEKLQHVSGMEASTLAQGAQLTLLRAFGDG